MRALLVILVLLLIGTISNVVCGPLGTSGPVKISDNNIENIYNINININGSFSNNLNQDIVSIVVGLLNEQSIGTADGKTLKERLIELAKSASNKNEKELNIDIPLEGNLNFVSLPDKIREAIEKKQQS